MNEFLQVILSYPTVPLTIGMGIVLCYWLFVMVGAVGIDLLDGAAEGATKGAAEAAAGALKGAAESAAGALKGAAEGAGGALKGAGEGAAELGGGDDLPSSMSLLAWLGLGKVPVTIAGSALTFSAWFFSVILTGELL